VRTAEKAGHLLDEMVPSIRRTSDLVQEIAAASAEQSTGVAQVNSAMTQISQTTQQTASASEELAATSEEMMAQTSALQDLMHFFTTDPRRRPGRGVASASSRPSGKQARMPSQPARVEPPVFDESAFGRF